VVLFIYLLFLGITLRFYYYNSLIIMCSAGRSTGIVA